MCVCTRGWGGGNCVTHTSLENKLQLQEMVKRDRKKRRTNGRCGDWGEGGGNDRVHLKGEALGDFLSPYCWGRGSLLPKSCRKGDAGLATMEGAALPRWDPGAEETQQWRRRRRCLLLLRRRHRTRVSPRRAGTSTGPFLSPQQ